MHIEKLLARSSIHSTTARAFLWIGSAVVLAISTVQAQTLLTETTWGGAGSDVADGVAAAPDGSSYVVGLTDSFRRNFRL